MARLAATSSRMGTSTTRSRTAVPVLAGAAALTLALYFVPQLRILAWPVGLLSTVVHEMGHGLTALALGGELHRLFIWPDGSGVAQYSGAFGRLASAATAAGGLLGPPVAAVALFGASHTPQRARVALAVFALVLIVSLVLWVRNPFGLAFLALLCGGLLLVCWISEGYGAQVVCAFVAMQLALSVFSRGDYLFTATAMTAQGPAPSDVSQIASALLLPYWFWGAVIAAASLLILGVGLRGVARALK